MFVSLLALFSNMLELAIIFFEFPYHAGRYVYCGFFIKLAYLVQSSQKKIAIGIILFSLSSIYASLKKSDFFIWSNDFCNDKKVRQNH